ncbi:MAG: hypothetical protein JW789_02590 [Candidatus Aenigmarchaeota archaeon]|nr:hypothetical protein [Candidatus Aenigmarchaeota archaeon]
MELKVLESKADKLNVEVMGETHTLLNIVSEYAWDTGASQSSYIIEHPYLSQPKLIVKAKNPKKTVSDAAQLVADRSKEFRVAFDRAAKK